MRKGLRALLAAAAVVALGTGAAWAKTDVRVTVAYYSPETGPIFEGMAKDFEAANPDVDIQIEVVNWDNLQQKLTTDIQGGTAPDIAIIGTRWLVDYSANDIAEPLDSYMTPEVKDRFIEAFLAPSTIDGKLWGLPVAASARAMYYNKDLLAKAGISDPPGTWDDLVAAADKVKALGGDAYGFGLQGKEIETDAYWYYALWTHGGSLIQDGHSMIASDSGVASAALYRSMIEKGLTQPGPTGSNRQDIEALFKQGRAAMILTGPWLRGQIKTEAPNLNYGIAAIPKASTQATYGVTDSIIIFKSSKVKDTAWKFLADTAFSPKWRKEFTLKEGFLPVTKAEADDPHFKDDPQLKAFTDMLPFARFAPLIPNWEEMADTTSAALQKIYLGEAEPAAALQEAAAKIDGLLK
ncbi:MAG: sugar ABC transporter substrate-binding protein [Geminicoccaceae bacterium]